MYGGEEPSQNEEFLFLGRKHCDVYNLLHYPAEMYKIDYFTLLDKCRSISLGAYLCSKENNCATNKNSMPFHHRKVCLSMKTEVVSPLHQVQAVQSP